MKLKIINKDFTGALAEIDRAYIPGTLMWASGNSYGHELEMREADLEHEVAYFLQGHGSYGRFVEQLDTWKRKIIRTSQAFKEQK